VQIMKEFPENVFAEAELVVGAVQENTSEIGFKARAAPPPLQLHVRLHHYNLIDSRAVDLDHYTRDTRFRCTGRNASLIRFILSPDSRLHDFKSM
jgi:hypothetical protein